MKYQVLISLGNNLHRYKEKVIMSYYIDYEDEQRSRFFKNGLFNFEKLEASETHITMPHWAVPRKFWYHAWHLVRLHVRTLKEQSKNKKWKRITGWRFEPSCEDPRGYVGLDPKRLP